MKNGKALQGHCRVRTLIGERKGRRSPSGGWQIGCKCGWSGGVHPVTVEANAEYRHHIDSVIEDPRPCKRCGEVKLPSEMADRYSRHICKRCYSQAGNAWAAAHPEASARHKRNHHLLMKYGITLEEADAMLEAQGGVCAICLGQLADRRNQEPHVDHDHATGQVCGILCFLCNAGLGQFRDDPNRLRAAIAYLEKPR